MMQTIRPRHFSAVQACLGESPVWDAPSGTLFYIDITAGEIHAIQGSQPPRLIYRSTWRVGALALTSDGNLIFTDDRQVALFDLQREKVTARSPQVSSEPSFRYNDGSYDPQGRFITGLMDEAHSAGSGSLHGYGADLQKNGLLSGMELPNGIAWSATGETVYYVDSVARAIYQADWRARDGTLHNARLLAQTPANLGRPDGIAVDIAGNIWVCQFNGGCLLHYSAEGHLLQNVEMPVPRPTSCCFGAEGLATLFVTSARFGMTPDELRRFPLAGDIFSLPVAVAGLAPYRFKDPKP